MSRAWRNWSGLVACAPARFERPTRPDEVAAVVRQHARDGKTLRVAGSGHSFTDLVATEGTLVSLDRLTGLVELDGASGRASVWAGTRLSALNEALDRRGLALENLGDIDVQSLAGAISTGTHGTGITLGSLSTQVCALTLVSGEGEVVECSMEREPEAFRAAQVSLGALGVIVRVGLRVVPAYRLREERRRERFEACAERLREHREGNRHFEFFWFPHTDTVQVKTLNPTDLPEDGVIRRAGRVLGDLAVENGAFGLLSRACRWRPSLCAPVSRLAAAFAGGGSRVGRSHRVFASPRLVRFQEMEYALPAEEGLPALWELRDWIATRRPAVHFPLEVRFVRGDDIDLSPCHGRDTAFVAVHMYQGMPFRKSFEAAERIFRGHGGRPHWGKWHSLTAAELRGLYPRWEAFQAVRRRLDPRGTFTSPYLEKLLGPCR